MTPGEMNFITRVQQFAKLLSAQYGEVSSINALWFGAEADYNDQITTADLQEVPAFAELTSAQVNELCYIAGQLKTLIDGRLEQIAILSQ